MSPIELSWTAKKWRFGRVLPIPDTQTDRQTTEYRATQLVSSIKHKLSHANGISKFPPKILILGAHRDLCFLDAPGGRKSAIPNILPSDLSKSVFNPYQLIPLCLHKFGCKKYDRGGLWISACIACHIIDFTCKSPIEYGCLVLCAVLCRQGAGAGWAAPVFKTIEPSSCNSNIVWNLYSVRSARFAISRSARLLNLV